jgi:hypothetical protein
LTLLNLFLTGLTHEYMGTMWAMCATKRRPWRAAGYSAACAVMTVLGIGGALHSAPGTIMLALGYAVGTFLGVKRGA